PVCRRQSLCGTSCIPVLPQSLYPADVLIRSGNVKQRVRMSERKILVIAALPYANGHIHLGHLVEYIQTDIWVRFQKLQGNKCLYLCADDTHGTAIMIRARQEGRSEDALIAEMKQAHERDFAGFDIQFDNYGSTNSAENRACCATIWSGLRKADL